MCSSDASRIGLHLPTCSAEKAVKKEKVSAGKSTDNTSRAIFFRVPPSMKPAKMP